MNEYFNANPIKNTSPVKAVFLSPPGVHLLDISGPAHIFYEAQEYGAKITSHYISLNEDTQLSTSSGLVFTELVPYHQVSLCEDDILFIPGLQAQLLFDPHFTRSLGPFLDWLILQYRQGATLCSVCTGAFLLAESGLLNGLQCTTHWKYFDKFQAKFPKVDLLTNRLFVENERIHTSAGVAAGIDLALYLLEKKYGSRFASDVAREVVVYLRRGESDPQLSIFLQYRNHQEDRVHEIQNWLSNHLSANYTLEDLALKVHTSARNLTRLFKNTTGITIGTYVEKLRVETAIQLLNEGAKVEMVARECGLKSTNQLRETLKKHTGRLPHDFLMMS